MKAVESSKFDTLFEKLSEARKLISEAEGLLSWKPNRAMLYKIEDSIIRAIKTLCKERWYEGVKND